MNDPVSSQLMFSVMAKHIGSGCNLNCTYCYYLEKERLFRRDSQQHIMSEKLLETYIAQTIYSSPDRVVLFAWHGGEPIMRGMDFFGKVIQLQKKHGTGREIENSLQTNGTMLTDEWCGFFTDHHFLIGISVDGPEHCHCVLENWMRVPPSVCVSAENCGHAGVVEYNGDVFAWDHFVFPEYKLGNINEKSLQTLMNSPFQRQFGQNKRDMLPAFCRKCEFLDLCNG